MSTDGGTQNLLVRWGANTIRTAFDEYQRDFRSITQRARRRFETRDWRGHQRDAGQRLGLVSERVWQTMLRLRTQFGPMVHDKALWTQMKAIYAESIERHPAVELAETFFNSVTRRIFTTVGVNPEIEFLLPESRSPPEGHQVSRTFQRTGTTAELVKSIIDAYRFDAPYRSIEEDIHSAAERVEAYCSSTGKGTPPEEVEMAYPIFFRGKGAYLIGIARRGSEVSPFILSMLHEAEGVFIDAVLLTPKDARVLFSFARSYFHVDTGCPAALVEYLRKLLPMRRHSELYIAIGQNKHGKTELYRDIMAHVARTDEKFEHAHGARGMVMIVFTLPSLNLVFKVIRDKIPPPKSTSFEEVKKKYNLVFRQDRAGRLVDAQEFEHLAFDKDRFEPAVLEELLRDASSLVQVQGDRVHLKHLYVERRVRPLDLYLREADPALATEAIIDYGKAIEDLAATNTFPGDLLLKNFGVTRNGRVIFYDYDELQLVTECRFRELPTPRGDDEETAGEPWFFVDENDIFPEEFLKFLGLTPELQKALNDTHGRILTADYWRKIQERLRAGEIVDIFPYPQARRLRPPPRT